MLDEVREMTVSALVSDGFAEIGTETGLLDDARLSITDRGRSALETTNTKTRITYPERVRILEEALRPFAAIATRIHETQSDQAPSRVKVGMIRRAAEAIRRCHLTIDEKHEETHK